MDNLIAANIRQRPIRSLVSVVGVALGVALVMLFTGLARGMSNDLQRRSQNLRAEIIFTRPGTMDNVTSSTANLSTKYVERLKKIAVLTPQPEVQVRGDGGARYESVGRIIYACQRAGIAKVGFITEPPIREAL